MKRPKKAFLICFIGMDGSGKTTQAKALIKTLKDNKVKSRYVHNRFVAFLTWPLIRIGKSVFFHRKGRWEDYDKYRVTRRRIFGVRPIAVAYQYLLLLDYLLQNIIKVNLPLALGNCLICDRYIYDTVVDLAVDLNYPEKKIEKILRRSFFLLPEPDIVFLMNIPEESAFHRKDDIPSLHFLEERRELYLNLAKKYGMTVVDGSEKPEELEQVIANRVKEIL